MPEIDDRVTALVYLMEHIIAKQLDDVPVPSFRPARIASEFRAFINKPKLAQEADETSILKLTHQLAFESVVRTTEPWQLIE
jgi:hypothetical protein